MIIFYLQQKNEEAPPSKKKKFESSTDMASDVTQIVNLDELEVYGNAEHPTGTTIASYSFEVHVIVEDGDTKYLASLYFALSWKSSVLSSFIFAQCYD